MRVAYARGPALGEERAKRTTQEKRIPGREPWEERNEATPDGGASGPLFTDLTP